jgi:hypothetical protein
MMAFAWQSSMDVAKSCLSFVDKVYMAYNAITYIQCTFAQGTHSVQQTRQIQRQAITLFESPGTSSVEMPEP